MLPHFTSTVASFEFQSDAYSKDMKAAIRKSVRLATRAFAEAVASRIPVRTGFLRGAFGTLEDVVGSLVKKPGNTRVRKNILKRSTAKLQEKIKNTPGKGVRRKEAEASFPKGKKREGANKILKEQEKRIAAEKKRLKAFQARIKKAKKIKDILLFDELSFKQGEYYYPRQVGRKGKKRGVRRGNPILKTTSSGQQFATPSQMILRPGRGVLGWTFEYYLNIRYYPFNDLIYGWNSWRAGVAKFQETLATAFKKYVPSMLSYINVSQVSNPYAGTSGKFNYVGELTPIDFNETISL